MDFMIVCRRCGAEFKLENEQLEQIGRVAKDVTEYHTIICKNCYTEVIKKQSAGHIVLKKEE